MRALTPWTPLRRQWRDLDMLPDRINRIFGRTPHAYFEEEPVTWMPDVNLVEGDQEFVLTADLPGMSSDEIEVDIEENVLTLTGEKETERNENKNGGRWHVHERTHGSFVR